MIDRPLRFCMITTFYPPYNFGGDGICIYRLSNELARRGHYVDVIHNKDAYLMLRNGSAKDVYPNHPNVKIHGLKSKFGFLSNLITQQTGKPFFKRKNIKDLIEKNRYDVIHYHNISLIGITTLQYGNAIKLYTMHEFWLACPMHVLWKFNREACTKKNCLPCTIAGKRPPQLWRYTSLLERMLQHVDCFISPSRFAKNKHHELGLNIPIKYIPNFLTKEEIQNDDIPTQNLLYDSPYFLFAGRLEKIKGVQNLIPVFKKHREYCLLVAGEGEYESVLRGLAQNVPNIKFLGKLGLERLWKLYRNAIAVIVPSICYDIFPTTLIEAFMMKTPVIVNNIGGMPEMIQDSGGGFVYSSQKELIEAMKKLVEDTDLRKDLGNKGYNAYLKLWSEDSHIERYLNLIKELQQKRDPKFMTLD